MIINEILKEKYRVQKKLSHQCRTMHEYFDKSREGAKAIEKEFGIQLNYKKCPTRQKQRALLS